MRIFIIFLSIITFIGCSSNPSKPLKSSQNSYSTDESLNQTTTKLRFKRPMETKTPAEDPVSVEDHIRCGLFLFDHCHYKEADEAFAGARNRILDHSNELYRACLISSGVCNLMANDKAGFIKNIKELKSTYNRYELLNIKNNQPRLKKLFSLYNQILFTGNY